MNTSLSELSNEEIKIIKDTLVNKGKGSEVYRILEETVGNTVDGLQGIIPKTLSAAVFRINGRLVKINKPSSESQQESLVGISPKLLGSAKRNNLLNSFVSLNSRFVLQDYNKNSTNQVASRMNFLKKFAIQMRMDAFTMSIQPLLGNKQLDIELLESELLQHRLPKCQITANPYMYGINLNTGDYLLAKKDLQAYCDLLDGGKATLQTLNTVKIALAMHETTSYSEYIDYFLARASRMNKLKAECNHFFSMRNGLTDIVPIAVNFPAIKEVSHSKRPDILLCNDLDNFTFTKLSQEIELYNQLIRKRKELGKESRGNIKSLGFTGNLSERIGLDQTCEMNELEVSYPQFISRLRKIEAPVITETSVINGRTIELICSSKAEISSLTHIQFNNYKFGAMHYILKCMYDLNLFSKLFPFTNNVDVQSNYSNQLNNVAYQLGLVRDK